MRWLSLVAALVLLMPAAAIAGETEAEILECMDELREAGVDILTFGQYLQPTAHHYPIERYVSPGEFEQYRQWGLEKGFLEVVSGVFVRSSYRAEQVLQKRGRLVRLHRCIWEPNRL